MGKVYTRFQTKTVQKPILWGIPPTPPRFGQIVVQIFSVREKKKKLKLSKTNLVASMHIERWKASVTVDVPRSKTVLLFQVILKLLWSAAYFQDGVQLQCGGKLIRVTSTF